MKQEKKVKCKTCIIFLDCHNYMKNKGTDEHFILKIKCSSVPLFFVYYTICCEMSFPFPFTSQHSRVCDAFQRGRLVPTVTQILTLVNVASHSPPFD